MENKFWFGYPSESWVEVYDSEDTQDIIEGLEALAEEEGTITIQEYLAKREDMPQGDIESD